MVNYKYYSSPSNTLAFKSDYRELNLLMYVYNSNDQQMVDDRVNQFRDQTKRRLDGTLLEPEYLPLRLQNGVYLQRYAHMLRIAIPYGLLSSKQIRMLAHIAKVYDKGYGHISTRQNIQYNWPELEQVPDILAKLASVQMHAIQTSGNCIRNTTADQFAGVATDELEDPRPWAELIRQWSTFHPEFAFLPRKFKIAVSGSKQDRVATTVHDVGIYLITNDAGEVGFKILAGGGLGRTPVIGSIICEWLPKKHLLSYLESILRVYNRFGRRDNKFKARIKILVRAMTPAKFAEAVNTEWQLLKNGPITVTDEEIARLKGFFTAPNYEDLLQSDVSFEKHLEEDADFARWFNQNTNPHKRSGYRSITLTLKESGQATGNVTDKQMNVLADLADKYSFGELRVSHNQNIILADIKITDLFEVWQQAVKYGLATPNHGLLTDMICCPGGDFCALANAKSIPIAKQLQQRFDGLDYLYDIGPLDLNISGCMNACGHHHIGHIGILGVDKKGSEFYQVSLGGDSGNDASLGKIIGPSFGENEIANVVETIIKVYLEQRTNDERFIDTYRRIGMQLFKERVYTNV